MKLWGPVEAFIRRFLNKFTIRFIVPEEYRVFGVTPLTFTVGVLAHADIQKFVIHKVEKNYVDVIIKNISRNTAIAIAKEYVFARAMIAQDAINSGVDLRQLSAISCIINSDRVESQTCKMFIKTGDVLTSSPDTLRRLCVNRGVIEDDGVY